MRLRRLAAVALPLLLAGAAYWSLSLVEEGPPRPEIAGRVSDTRPALRSVAAPRLAGTPARRASRDTTDADERYLVVTPSTGTSGGTTGPSEVERPDRVEAPVLEVRGEGWFSGVVVFPDGSPASDVTVQGSIDLSRGGSWGASRSPGFVSVRAHTDAEGRFRIAGLRPGPYVADVDETETTPGRIRTEDGATNLRFVVRRRRLRVRIRDAEGRALEKASLYRFDPAKRSSSGLRAGSRTVCYYGDGGERYFLCAHDKDHVPLEQEVTLPEDAWSRDVDLVLRPPGKDVGRLLLRVEDPSREAVARYVVTVRTLHTGGDVSWLTRVRPDGDGVVPDVPPGTWRVRVDPMDPEDETTPLLLFPARTEVEVAPYATAVVDLRCRAGGRIRIASTWPEGVSAEPMESDIDLEGPAPTPVHYLWPDPEEPRLTPLLEPGRWDLVVTGDHLQPLRVPVDVHPGGVVDVTLRLAEAKPTR